MGTPRTVSEFLDLVEKSNLLEPPLVDHLRKQVPPNDEPANVRKYGRRLVNNGILTWFHVRQLLAGKHRGFFIGKYRILDLLGSGGVARVFLAEQLGMRRPVALKVLLNTHKEDAAIAKRFEREARAAARLHHPNIAQVFDFDDDGQTTFIAMEYVPGLDLDKIIQKHGPLEAGTAADYVCQAAGALQAAHRENLVHRDLKPGNLIVSANGVLKLLDLGLVIFNDEREASNLTNNVAAMGTADFMSPEQALDCHNVDIRADIYSLGCTFYMLLTGRPPYPDKTFAQKLIAHQNAPMEPIDQSRQDVPQAVCEVVAKMTAKNPADRYQTPEEIKEDLLPYARRTVPPFEVEGLTFSEETLKKLLKYGPKKAPAAKSDLAVRTFDPGGENAVMETGSAIKLSGSPTKAGLSSNTFLETLNDADEESAEWLNRVSLSSTSMGSTTILQKQPLEPTFGKRKPLPWMVAAAAVVFLLSGMLWYALTPSTKNSANEPEVADIGNSDEARSINAVSVEDENKNSSAFRKTLSANQSLADAVAEAEARTVLHLPETPGGWESGEILVSPTIPSKGRLTIEGASPTVRIKRTGNAPLFRILDGRHFVVRNLTIDAGAVDRPVIEIEGNAAGVTFQKVTIVNYQGDVVRLLSAKGTLNEPIRFEKVSMRNQSRAWGNTAFAVRARSVSDSTTQCVEILRCTLGGAFSSAVLVAAPVQAVSVFDCHLRGNVWFSSQPNLEQIHRRRVMRDWRVSPWLQDGVAPDVSLPPDQQKSSIQFTEVQAQWALDFVRTVGKGRGAAWAYTPFKSDKAGSHVMFIGMNSDLQIWINGEQVYDHSGPHVLMDCEVCADVQLRKGVNHVWIRMRETQNRCAAVLRMGLDDYEVTPPRWQAVQLAENLIENACPVLISTEPSSDSSIRIVRNDFQGCQFHPILVRTVDKANLNSTIKSSRNKVRRASLPKQEGSYKHVKL